MVLVSDHGFYLGDYGYTGKTASMLHPALIRVPLIVVDPARRRAGDTKQLVRLHPRRGPDGPVDGRGAGATGMDGADLSRLFEGRRPPERAYSWGGYGNSWYVHTDRWAAFGGNSGEGPSLFDRRRDPGERRNLAARPRRVRPGRSSAPLRSRAGASSRLTPTEPSRVDRVLAQRCRLESSR